MIIRVSIVAEALGAALIVAGLWFIYPPIAAIAAGGFLIVGAYAQHQPGGSDG